MDRRSFLARAGALTALAAAALPAGCELVREEEEVDGAAPEGIGHFGEWEEVRRAFNLSEGRIHISALLISAHPRPVREAIERHRQGLDADPVTYLEENIGPGRRASREAAAGHLGTSADLIALTDSTTMGIGLVYNGLDLDPGDEILTTDHDYYATHEALRQASDRSGAEVRRIELFDDPATATVDEIADRVLRAVSERTRVLALTWVHSSTGMKLPVAAIREAVDEAAARWDNGPILIALDGVHGFGIEDVSIDELGCDFFMAGCHKWIFGPRGTGILWARGDAWERTRPTIPSFIEDASWGAWTREAEPAGPNNAERMTPGGFKAFEHRWAMAEAFEFLGEVGKERVQQRTHDLASRLKDGLAEMDHVRLQTPRSPELSSGIVCFDVDGRSAATVRGDLRARDIIASTTPYAVSHARLTPSIQNSEEEVDRVLDVIGEMG